MADTTLYSRLQQSASTLEKESHRAYAGRVLTLIEGQSEAVQQAGLRNIARHVCRGPVHDWLSAHLA